MSFTQDYIDDAIDFLNKEEVPYIISYIKPNDQGAVTTHTNVESLEPTLIGRSLALKMIEAVVETINTPVELEDEDDGDATVSSGVN